ncbi:hypothetical protein ACSBR2_033545 [Camellia fascicularis]
MYKYNPQSFHTSLIKNGLLYNNNVYQSNLLLQSYVKSQSFIEAHKLLHLLPHPNLVSYNTILSGFFKSILLLSQALNFFDSIPQKDCQSWNIVISGFAQHQRLQQALTHFIKMRRCSIKPDNYTYSIVLPCCDFEFGKQVHAEVVKAFHLSDEFLGTNLLRMCSGPGDMDSAKKVFDEMPRRDLVAWNALIFCYSKCGMGHVGVELFRQMGIEGVIADDYTYAIVLNEFVSRSQVFEAMQVHSSILRCGICLDCFISNSLLNLYSKCSFIASAMLLFEEMPNLGCCFLDINYFWNLTLWPCEQGILVISQNAEANVVVASAIVDMYSKCGETDDAFRVFQTMPERDIASWNGIICGFAQNGEAMKALKLYDELLLSKSPIIAPNGVTFVGVLNACRHSGLAKEGYDYFNDMIHRYLIKPEAEHFTCMLDLLARAGLLQEAEALMKALPFKPDVVMLSSMLGACKLHRNLEMARHVAKHLYVDEPWNSSNYVLLSNLYADIGRRSEAIEVREVMDDRGVQKILGLSWVEIGSCMHSFVAADKLHPCIVAICDVLQRLSLQMQESYQNEFSFPLN